MNKDIYQVILIATQFNGNLRHRALFGRSISELPLCNQPLLLYNLSLLQQSSEVKDVFIFAHSREVSKINEIVSSFRNSVNCDHLIISVFDSEGYQSIGDVIRDADTKAIIHSDFILMECGAVTNVPLMKLFRSHVKRRKSDDKNALTMGLMAKQRVPFMMNKKCSSLSLMLSRKTCRILKYKRHYHIDDSFTSNFRKKRKRSTDSLSSFKSIHGRDSDNMLTTNLVDCGIWFCSPQVPPLFAENFDDSDMDDFIRGLLINEEILGHTAYVVTAENSYSLFLNEWNAYCQCSVDMILRWTFPFVPDNTIIENNYRGEQKQGDDFSCAVIPSFSSRNSIYKNYHILGVGYHLIKNVVIGKNCRIGTEAKLMNCVIGNECNIGANSTICNSFFGDRVSVGTGCFIDHCVLGDDSELKFSTIIEGTDVKVIGENVTLGPNILIDKEEFLVVRDNISPHVSNEISEEDSDADNKTLFGIKSNCCRFSLVRKMMTEQREDDWGSSDDSDISSQDELIILNEGKDGNSDVLVPPRGILKKGVGVEKMSADTIGTSNYSSHFYNEISDSFKKFYSSDCQTPQENLILEINSAKHAYNIAIKDVNMMVLTSLLTNISSFLSNNNKKKLSHEKLDVGPREILQEFNRIFSKLKPLLSNYIKNDESQLDCLLGIQQACIEEPKNFIVIVVKIVQLLYEQDILDEDAILKWYGVIEDKLEELNENDVSESSKAGRTTNNDKNSLLLLRSNMKPMIDWLENSSASGSSSEAEE